MQKNNQRAKFQLNEEIGEEEDVCVFCLGGKDGTQAVLYCGHSFHHQCFSDWLRQKSGELKCPVCKRGLTL